MIDSLLLRLHHAATGSPLPARGVAFTRLLLASGFVLPALTKVLGNRFTVLPTDTPVGAFFEAMYQTGGYWRFLGLAQLLAAVLVVIPRTALMGACLFFGIMLNITVLTFAIGFAGTPWIALLMLAATAALLVWDYPALRPMLGLPSREIAPALTPLRLSALEWSGAVLATTVAWFTTLFLAGWVGAGTLPSLLTGTALAILGGTLLVGPAALAYLRVRLARHAKP